MLYLINLEIPYTLFGGGTKTVAFAKNENELIIELNKLANENKPKGKIVVERVIA